MVLGWLDHMFVLLLQTFTVGGVRKCSDNSQKLRAVQGLTLEHRSGFNNDLEFFIRRKTVQVREQYQSTHRSNATRSPPQDASELEQRLQPETSTVAGYLLWGVLVTCGPSVFVDSKSEQRTAQRSFTSEHPSYIPRPISISGNVLWDMSPVASVG